MVDSRRRYKGISQEVPLIVQKGLKNLQNKRHFPYQGRANLRNEEQFNKL